ncbi:MAG: hypothetical protein Q7S27_00885 [Nanoarchaeota archaeon]|nr:hypothetical protein [Nanoarchaeota archaeon]
MKRKNKTRRGKNLTTKHRSKGGRRSAAMQDRDDDGRFSGRRNRLISPFTS